MPADKSTPQGYLTTLWQHSPRVLASVRSLVDRYPHLVTGQVLVKEYGKLSDVPDVIPPKPVGKPHYHQLITTTEPITIPALKSMIRSKSVHVERIHSDTIASLLYCLKTLDSQLTTKTGRYAVHKLVSFSEVMSMASELSQAYPDRLELFGELVFVDHRRSKSRFIKLYEMLSGSPYGVQRAYEAGLVSNASEYMVASRIVRDNQPIGGYPAN